MDYSNFNHIDTRISHLSDTEKEALMLRYYNGEKASDLIKEYKIRITASNLYKVFPPIIYKDMLCPYCGLPMISERVSRTNINLPSTPRCSKCMHINSNNCKCEICIEKREDEARKEHFRKRQLINDVYSLKDAKPVNIKDLDLYDRVYLGTILRLGLNEDYSIISFDDSNYSRLAPSSEFRKEILVSLRRKDIIKVHPNSSIDSFKEDDHFPYKYYVNTVQYHLNLYSEEGKSIAINSLMNPSMEDYEKYDSTNFYKIWRQIALEECKEYLLYNMNQVGFSFDIGEKTINMLEDLIDNFSVSQIYAIIYRSVSNATRYYQESRIPKKQAANSVIGNCQRYAERALINTWDINGFRRDFNCPQTAISEFFFNRVLRIGDRGFTDTPRII